MQNDILSKILLILLAARCIVYAPPTDEECDKRCASYGGKTCRYSCYELSPETRSSNFTEDDLKYCCQRMCQPKEIVFDWDSDPDCS